LAAVVVGVWQFAMGLPASPANVETGIFQPFVIETINRTLTSLGFLIFICGFILLLSGLVTFLRYRKENPTPYAEDV
jgi:hypothetical protein